MIDPVSSALGAIANRSAYAVPLVFAAGVATSVGPCIAPRYVALAAVAQASSRPWSTLGVFVTGLVAAYVALGLAADALGTLWSASRTVYLALATALALAGLVTIVRGNRREHAHSRRTPASIGGVFLLGASGAIVVSPCCTPIVAAIAGFTTLAGHGLDGAVLLGAFALGHALPLAFCGAIGARFSSLFLHVAASHASRVIAGTLMLALATYFGTLA